MKAPWFFLAVSFHVGAACDLTGTWVGETKMDKSKVPPTPSKLELQSNGARVSGVRVAQVIGGKEFPQAGVSGEVQDDGSAMMMVDPSSRDDVPTNYTLRVSPDCSRLDGRWSVEIRGRQYTGTVFYKKQ